jgi:chalcone isomerase-like protein
MPGMKRTGLILLFAAIPLGGAFGAKKSGVELPDTVQVGDKSLVLNGLGLREATVFNVNVYVAGLWVEAKSTDGAALAAADSPKRLDLVFVRDVDRGDIVDAFKEGFKKNGGDMAKLKDRIGQLSAWMPDLKKKDVLSFTYVPGTGLSVSVKGQVKGTIPGADFQNSFFRIWLGPEPPNKGLKKGLLGQ